jgi:hypothetical protein
MAPTNLPSSLLGGMAPTYLPSSLLPLTAVLLLPITKQCIC